MVKGIANPDAETTGNVSIIIAALLRKVAKHSNASNSTDFNQILNRASSEHMQTIQNVIKDTSPSQEHPQSSSTPAKTPEM